MGYLVHDVVRESDGFKGLEGVGRALAHHHEVVLLAVIGDRNEAGAAYAARAGHVAAVAIESSTVRDVGVTVGGAVVTAVAVRVLRVGENERSASRRGGGQSGVSTNAGRSRLGRKHVGRTHSIQAAKKRERVGR